MSRTSHSGKPRSRLAGFPFFHGLSSAALSRAEALVTELELPVGRVICEQGALGREAFFILRGAAVVIRDGAGVATLGPGDVVGEGALLGDGRRSATVRVTEPMTTLVMNAREFLTLMQLPGVGEEISRVAEERRATYSPDTV